MRVKAISLKYCSCIKIVVQNTSAFVRPGGYLRIIIFITPSGPPSPSHFLPFFFLTISLLLYSTAALFSRLRSSRSSPFCFFFIIFLYPCLLFHLYLFFFFCFCFYQHYTVTSGHLSNGCPFVFFTRHSHSRLLLPALRFLCLFFT